MRFVDCKGIPEEKKADILNMRRQLGEWLKQKRQERADTAEHVRKLSPESMAVVIFGHVENVLDGCDDESLTTFLVLFASNISNIRQI
jgi:hypothetical protein